MLLLLETGNVMANHVNRDSMQYSNLGLQYLPMSLLWDHRHCFFDCIEVLQPSQPTGVMLSVISLLNHTFTGQA